MSYYEFLNIRHKVDLWGYLAQAETEKFVECARETVIGHNKKV